MALLTWLFGRREFPIPQFDLAPLAFELKREEDELILNEASADWEDDANVVAIRREPRTPGEMRESIERHLRLARDDGPPLLEQDAVDELREALAKLRRSLG